MGGRARPLIAFVSVALLAALVDGLAGRGTVAAGDLGPLGGATELPGDAVRELLAPPGAPEGTAPLLPGQVTTPSLPAAPAPGSSSAELPAAAPPAALPARHEAPPVVPLAIELDRQGCAGLRIRWTHEAAGPPADAVTADLDGDGAREVLLSGTEGIRALRPGLPTASATLWRLAFQAVARHVVLAELDGRPGAELVAATLSAKPERAGVVALDAATGAVRWSRRIAGGAVNVRAADVTGAGRQSLVVAGGDQALYVLSGLDGGDLRPPRPLGAAVTDLRLADFNGGPLDAVVTLADGQAAAVDLAADVELWRYRASGGELRAAAVGDLTGSGTADVVVAGTGIALTATPGRGDDTTSVGGLAGALVAALDGRDGRLLWDYGQPGPLRFSAVALGDLTADGTPDVVAHAGRFRRGHLVALDGRGRSAAGLRLGEAAVLWTFDTTRGTGDLQGAYSPDGLVMADGNDDGAADAYLASWSGALLAVDGAARTPTPLDLAVDAPTATSLWEVVRSQQHRHVSLLPGGGGLFALGLAADHLVALRDARVGRLVWAYDAGGHPALAVGSYAARGVPGIGVGTTSGRVYGLAGSGALLTAGDVFLPERVAATVAADLNGDGVDELVAVTLQGDVWAVDPRGGTVIWTLALGAPVRTLAAAPGLIAAGLSDGRVVALEPGNGAKRWESAGAAAVTGLAYAPTTGLLAAGDAAGMLRLLDLAGLPRTTADTETAGQGGIAGVVPADVDGDGLQGFAVAAGSSLQAFTPTGVRQLRHNLPLQATHVAAGDLTGDGADELVATSLDGHAHAVAGPGGAPLWSLRHGAPGAVAVADLRGTGRAEAVLTTRVDDAGDRVVRTVAADGAVTGACVLRKAPYALAVADFDRDGADDIALSTTEGDVYTLQR